MKAFYLILLAITTLLFASCKKDIQNKNSSDATLADNNTSVNATAVCDYDLDETTLTSTGWTKVFEDNFSTDLSKWNIWTGGAFNNELEYYQSANLQVTNGNLVITARRETVTGATTTFDPTPKTFNYTSGRVECKTNVSAKSTTPKVRMIARIKLP